MREPKKVYGDDFYRGQMNASYESAKVYAGHLSGIFLPRSVVDVGCGRGAWLKAFKELGVQKLSGFDGNWNSQEKIVDDAIAFTAFDLNQPIRSVDAARFDLAMSLEVAEHLEPASAATFVESLTGLSDLVMFGAAFTGQGGKNHINEQMPSYWARLFLARRYVPFDVFRPALWGDERVRFWYRQNTFLYAKDGSGAYEAIRAKGYHPVADIAFMDCVHPELYFKYMKPTFKRGFKMIRRALYNGVRRRAPA